MCVMQKDEAHTEQSQERGSQKRLYEYAKKVVSYGFVMMSALSVKTSDYFKIWAFKVSVAMFLFAFFTDILSAWLILNSLHFLTEYPIYISSVTQMLMPLFLFFSFGELHPYMIILTAALLLFSIALFHLACFQAGTTTDASKLDHIFDISAGVYALSTGSALTIALPHHLRCPIPYAYHHIAHTWDHQPRRNPDGPSKATGGINCDPCCYGPTWTATYRSCDIYRQR
jgi:hypothetical protein